MGKLTFDDFVAEQRRGMPPVVKGDLTGKTVIVTGANIGLGLEAAKHFATMNPERLIVVCRSVEKGQETVKIIKEATGYTKAEAWTLDLAKFSTVSAFADRAEKELDRLDILVENAAVALRDYTLTEDGWETSLQVNSLAPALHALLLLPKMIYTSEKHSTTPRLVMVASDTHFWCSIKPEAINAPNTIETLSSKEFCTPSVMHDRYPETKLLNVTFIRALAERLSASHPTVTPVTLNPGFCFSGLVRNTKGEDADRLHKMQEDYAFTSEEGSRQIIYSAVGGEESELRGGYVSFSKVIEVSDFILSDDGRKVQDKTWDEMLELFGKLDNRITKVVEKFLKA